MADKDYQVLSPIKHGGKRYEIGATVTMDEKDAKPFMGSVLTPAPKAEAPVKTKAAPRTEAPVKAD